MATAEQLKQLDKEVRRTKRIATEWASQLHDLVEDKLPAGYEQLPQIAKSTFDACVAWRQATDAFEQASKVAGDLATADAGGGV
jgi:hypothetical protein